MTLPDKDVKINTKVRALLEKAEQEGVLTPHSFQGVDLETFDKTETYTQILELLGDLGISMIAGDGINLRGKDLQNDRGGYYSPDLDGIASDDTISLYLKEMSVVPLLSMEEEIDLAKRIERASVARRELVGDNGQGYPNRQKELEFLIQDGFFAREYLIKANTRLVVSIARKYIGQGVPFLDLIQEGNLGLMRAVEKFEYRRGYRFSTYATWWIRQSISRAVAYQARTIRVPVHMVDRLREMYKSTREIEQTLGRLPTADELAEHMEIETSRVRWMQQVAQNPISLESPIDDDGSEIGALVEDESAQNPAQIAYQNMLRERIEDVLATLSPREARVLRLRFGLGEDRPYTLEEVGRKFGLTRERIRQIEGNALRRLRHPKRAKLLQDYL